jgi:phage terminase large subunit-like protein
MTSSFRLTAKQREAEKAVLMSDATFNMLFGGGRSGKTALIVRTIAARAIKAPLSRHAIFRYRFNAVKSSIVLETFPKIMALAFPGVTYEVNKTDWVARLYNGSEIWFGGLDDKERTEKILGKEFATIYLNEGSQIPYSSRQIAITRLAQKVMCLDGKPLKLKLYEDENPPNKAHWSYKLYIKKVDPETNLPLSNPDNYLSYRLNPADNVDNLAEGYLDTLKGQSARLQKRFLLGEFADATPNALFNESDIDTWRVLDGIVPDFVRVIVAVDPSGSGDIDNADNDAIGICVVGLGQDGNAYLIEDCTVKAGPGTWGRIATSAFDRHAADLIVGEANFGGDMVRHTIQTARPRTPYKAVMSSRGKHVRAEPMSALYEQGKVRHIGYFRELEDELVAFSTVGYTGDRSPNRADALIFALTELFQGLTRVKETYTPPEQLPQQSNHWY